MGTGQKVGTGRQEERRWVRGRSFKESEIPTISGLLIVTERAGVLPAIQ